MTADRPLIDIHRDHLRHRIGRVANLLRALAVTVEGEAERLDDVPSPGVTSFGHVVANVQHEVLWALANLGLDGLTRNAANADRDRIEEKES